MDEPTTVRLPCQQALAFGPVPSRRLGVSLGVNVVPNKTCSYNCVYCQLGKTTKLTVERREYTPTEAVLDAVVEKLEGASEADYITFIGDGEPTLASNLAEVAHGISERWDSRLALLTNGSLLWMLDVRADASMFDVVLPTLAAGDADVFRKIHRPHGSLSFDRCVQGLRDFVNGHDGATWAEVMLIAGLNDHIESLRSIGEMIARIGPDEVHLTAPLRPPSVSSVRPPSRETVELALDILPGAIDFTHPEGNDMPAPRSNPAKHVVDVAGTHPLRLDQAMAVFVGAGYDENEAHEALDSLVRSRALVALERDGMAFFVRGRRA